MPQFPLFMAVLPYCPHFNDVSYWKFRMFLWITVKQGTCSLTYFISQQCVYLSVLSVSTAKEMVLIFTLHSMPSQIS